MATSLFPLYWLLGADSDGVWHQRIIQAPNKARAQAWWLQTIDQTPAVAVSQVEVEAALQALQAAATELGQATVFGAWVGSSDDIALLPIPAKDRQSALDALQRERPDLELFALVDVTPLLQTAAHMRAIVAGEYRPDERLR